MYKNERRKVIRRIFINLLILVGLPLLWFSVFIAYPLSTMTTLSGKVIKYKLHVTKTERGGTTFNYVFMLDRCKKPVRLQLKKKKDIFNYITSGTEVCFQISQKDFVKLRDLPASEAIYEIEKIRRSEIPRIYGIDAPNGTVISSFEALCDTPAPYLLGQILLGLGIVYLTFIFLVFCRDCKKMYRLLKTTDINRKYSPDE